MPAMSVSVEPKTLVDLEEAVIRTGRNKNRIIDDALTEYLARLKADAEDARLADEAFARFQASGEKAVPAEAVYEELGL